MNSATAAITTTTVTVSVNITTPTNTTTITTKTATNVAIAIATNNNATTTITFYGLQFSPCSQAYASIYYLTVATHTTLYSALHSRIAPFPCASPPVPSPIHRER